MSQAVKAYPCGCVVHLCDSHEEIARRGDAMDATPLVQIGYVLEAKPPTEEIVA